MTVITDTIASTTATPRWGWIEICKWAVDCLTDVHGCSNSYITVDTPFIAALVNIRTLVISTSLPIYHQPHQFRTSTALVSLGRQMPNYCFRRLHRPSRQCRTPKSLWQDRRLHLEFCGLLAIHCFESFQFSNVYG